MATDEFPIGQPLTAVSILEDKDFSSNELCLDKVQLFFQDTTVTLLPIADTDEIEIIQKTTNINMVSAKIVHIGVSIY